MWKFPDCRSVVKALLKNVIEVAINSMFENFVHGVLFSAFRYFWNEYNMRELYGFVCKKIGFNLRFFLLFQITKLESKDVC